MLVRRADLLLYQAGEVCVYVPHLWLKRWDASVSTKYRVKLAHAAAKSATH